MSTPFLIDDATITRLRDLKSIAEANPVSEQDMRRIIQQVSDGIFAPDPRNTEQTITLPFGYTLTFTVEWQPVGMCRHVSMASPAKQRIPVDAAMNMVMPHLGFREHGTRQSWPEHLSDDRIAHNIIEVM